MTVSGTSSPSPATPVVSTAAPLCPSRLEAQLRRLSSLSRPLRILAADDNVIHHRIIGQILRKQFPEVLGDVEFVSSGYVVLDYLAHHEYDLVLLDIDMPGLSGIETARLIRAGQNCGCDVPVVLPCNQDIPIIAVTSNSLDHHRQHYSEVGINDCVAKPVNAQELRRAIDHVTSEASAIPVLASD
ncbi:sensitivity to red-light reduced protein [Dimargaris xerosporica]|nr:sensitivity to red-light reduced protein [Dimargaris xerosporica]